MRFGSVVAGSIVWAVVSGACGAGDSTTDGGASDATVDAGFAVAPPDIPWLAEGVPPIGLSPCPEGWREVTSGDVTTCDPYPDGGPLACDAGEAHFPGEPGCRPIGDPCPAGDYARGLPTDGSVVYVEAGATAGGDGSMDAPFATLADVGWSSLSAGTTVALARGTYEGPLPLRAGVRVVGACVAETRVTGVSTPVVAVVTVTNAGDPAVLRNVTVADAPQYGVMVRDRRALTLEGVSVERTQAMGIYVLEGGRLIANDTVVRDTQPDGGGMLGRGVELQTGAHLEATRLLVEGNRDVGMYLIDSGTEALLVDSVVRDTQARMADGGFGRGVDVGGGARLEATRFVVANNRDFGVDATGPGSLVVLTDAVVRDTQPWASIRRFGRGVEVEDGARFEGRRLIVRDSFDTGLYVTGAGSSVVLEDAVVRNTQPTAADDGGGRAIDLEFGARLTATRLVVELQRESGIFAIHAGTRVELTDVAVRDTESRVSDGMFGHGVNLEEGASLDATRLLVERSHGSGMRGADEGTEIAMRDVVVRDTRAQATDLAFGHGLQIANGARVVGERVRVDGARELGLLAFNGASVELSDVVISNVERSECDCPDRVHGHGVAAVVGAARLTRFEIRDTTTCGLFVASTPEVPGAPSLDVGLGIVERAAIGACVQVDGYDLSRLTREVAYRENGANLESTMLPVPTVR